MSRRALFTLVAVVLASCGGEESGGTTPPPPQLFSIAIVGGSGQSAVAGSPLPAPLIVRVTDANGAAAVGRSVAWSFVGAPTGLLQANGTVTDADGITSNTVTLGATPGTYTIEAVVANGAAPARFTVVASGQPAVQPTLVAEVPIPPNYGIHDTFVRDGIAFVSAWNTGMRLYDVGGGGRGGSPANPVLISTIITATNGVAGGAQVHNAWWFHNRVRNEKRYLFVGQEGPGVVGSQSSGDLHVVDVSDLANPVEVAFLRIPGAGVHNFWMDEGREVLFASWYNGGVVAVDVSGTLSGNLASRVLTQALPGGGNNTYIWGVMLVGNTLFASDMRSGFWALDPVTLTVRGGGNNVQERFGSDLWVHGTIGYSGTWGVRGGIRGNVVKIWALGAGGIPTLADSLTIAGIGTVSDVAVTPDGKALVVTAENLDGAGLYVYDRANPLKPQLRGRVLVTQGLHTGEIAVINGRTYVFAARNPSNPALMVFDITGVVP